MSKSTKTQETLKEVELSKFRTELDPKLRKLLSSFA